MQDGELCLQVLSLPDGESQAQSKSPSAEVASPAVEGCSCCCALQHNIYYSHGFSWGSFPNISAEVLEEAGLHLCESVHQAAFPYIWWFACYSELDQRLCSNGLSQTNHSICSFLFLQTKQTQQVWCCPVKY